MAAPIAINISNREKYLLRVGEEFAQMSGLALNWLDEYFDDIIEKTGVKPRMFEYGSGLSTVWFAENIPNIEIYSLEGNKGWFDFEEKIFQERGLKNIHHIFVEQTGNYRDYTEKVNFDYVEAISRCEPPFDLIINDGFVREYVGEYILEHADNLIKVDGLYLRHDYDKAVKHDWLGFCKANPQEVPEKLGYDIWTAKHPNYEMITLPGNGKWGYRLELGGVWRRL